MSELMTDSLRDRIAKTIYQTPPAWGLFPWDDLTVEVRQVYLEQADAVIASLDSKGWLIDPESEDRIRRARNKRWLEGENDD